MMKCCVARGSWRVASLLTAAVILLLFPVKNASCMFSPVRSAHRARCPCSAHYATVDGEIERAAIKKRLLRLLECTPRNARTPSALTTEILSEVRLLEKSSPVTDGDFLSALAGNWELLWTVQDVDSAEYRNSLIRRWIK